jgi:putative Mn2+ efflux pump MntP
VLALILVSLSLGLSNFAAAIGMGISGTSAAARLRVGLVFGVFEAGMPVAGLALGRGLAHALGGAARWISAGLLIATGAWTLIQAVRADHGAVPEAAGHGTTGRLVLTGLALSVDNLAVGFALGAFHVSLAAAVAVIGAVSVILSLAGLELGARIGARTGRRGELAGGLILIAVGAAVAAGLI